MARWRTLLVSPFKFHFVYSSSKPFLYFGSRFVNLTVILVLAIFLMGNAFQGSFYIILCGGRVCYHSCTLIGTFIPIEYGFQQTAIAYLHWWGNDDSTDAFTGVYVSIEICLCLSELFPTWVPSKMVLHHRENRLWSKGLGLFGDLEGKHCVLVGMTAFSFVVSFKNFKNRLGMKNLLFLTQKRV